MEKQLFSRKEVARLLVVQPKTIRVYERKGLIKPDCYVRNRPRYTADEIARVLKLEHESR